MPAKPKKFKPPEYEPEKEEEVNAESIRGKESLKELQSMEDDFSDDRYLEKIR